MMRETHLSVKIHFWMWSFVKIGWILIGCHCFYCSCRWKKKSQSQQYSSSPSLSLSLCHELHHPLDLEFTYIFKTIYLPSAADCGCTLDIPSSWQTCRRATSLHFGSKRTAGSITVNGKACDGEGSPGVSSLDPVKPKIQDGFTRAAPIIFVNGLNITQGAGLNLPGLGANTDKTEM